MRTPKRIDSTSYNESNNELNNTQNDVNEDDSIVLLVQDLVLKSIEYVEEVLDSEKEKVYTKKRRT